MNYLDLICRDQELFSSDISFSPCLCSCIAQKRALQFKPMLLAIDSIWGDDQ